MRQNKYFDISRNIQIYIKEKDSIENKKITFLNCINEINNLKDWLKEDKNIKNGKDIANNLYKGFFRKIANEIANANKHKILNKNGKEINDFIEIKTTSDLILKTNNKNIDNDLIITRKNDINEYKYIEIKEGKLTGYELLNNCLNEIHHLINKNDFIIQQSNDED